METNLWPKINFEDGETSLSIIREQANVLGKNTKNILKGEVKITEAVDDKVDHIEIVLIYQFYIIAPFLGNYRFLLFNVMQRAEPLKLEIYDFLTKDKLKTNGLQDFKEKIKDILSSGKTIELIKALYLQSKEMNKK